jgi:hypothetical protein
VYYALLARFSYLIEAGAGRFVRPEIVVPVVVLLAASASVSGAGGTWVFRAAVVLAYLLFMLWILDWMRRKALERER